MYRLLRLFAVPCLLAAQSGPFSFLEMTTVETPKGREVAVAAGTLTLSPGACAVNGRAARNREAAKPMALKPACQQTAPGQFMLDSPTTLGGMLKLSASEDGRVLVGAGAKAGAHSFFVAIPAPAAGASAPISTAGMYRAAWLQVAPVGPRGIASGLVNLPFTPRRVDETASLVSHSTEFDDVTRELTFAVPKIEAKADGTGTISFPANDANLPLAGVRDVLLAADGSFFLGWSAGAGARDILVGVREDPEASSFSWMGAFAMAEWSATVPYEMNAKPAMISSAMGTARNGGRGALEIEQTVWDGKSTKALVTRNVCRTGTDGSSALGPVVHATQSNLVIGGNPMAFAGVMAGARNELSLDHGIFFGVRTSNQVPPAPAPLKVTHADGSAVDAAKPARSGETITIEVPNYKAGPAHVFIDSLPAEAKAGSPLTVTVPKLKRGGVAPLAVEAPGLVHDITDLPVQP